MNFTSKIRSSLLSDAKNGASLRRWSIRDLIDFRLGGESAAENAKSLLREVQIRLACQHGRLDAFSSSIEGYANVATSEGDRVRRNLKNLRQLHENTYSLPYQIVDNGDGRSAVLENFSSEPNRRHVSDAFDQIMTRHGSSVETLADAVIHARNMEGGLPGTVRRNFLVEAELTRDAPVESFLHSRLLVQLLSDHYVSLSKGKPAGAVSLGADVVDVVDDAVTEARHVCDANLGVAPEVRVRREESIEGEDFRPPPLIRSWVHHAIVELTKNAMTSNVQRWSAARRLPESMPPDIYISVGKETIDDEELLRIRIMDQGTGVKDQERAFGFARTASSKRWDRLQEQQSYAAVRQPLESLGVGLPLSRLMMRTFGGDLVLSNHEQGDDTDSGCTATLSINYDDTYKAKN